MLQVKDVDGIVELWDFVNDGGFIIRFYGEDIRLFEVPLYGGEEYFFGSYKTVKEALEQGYKWT